MNQDPRSEGGEGGSQKGIWGQKGFRPREEAVPDVSGGAWRRAVTGAEWARGQGFGDEVREVRVGSCGLF